MTARQIAECRDHADLVAAIRLRLDELNVVPETIDHIAGLPARYLHKIIAPMGYKPLSTLTLGLLLQSLGLKLIVAEDVEALEKVRSRLVKRKSGRSLHNGVVHQTFSHRYLQKLGRLGGKARMAKMTPRQRAKLARLAGKARLMKIPAAQRAQIARIAAAAMLSKRRLDSSP